MAKIKLGIVVADIRGKLGGVVFNKSRAGAGVRTGNRSTGNVTRFQSVQRSIVAAASNFYRNELSDQERLLWSAHALNHPQTNIFSDTVILSGFHAFLRQNQYRRMAWFEFPDANAFEGNPWIIVPPDPFCLSFDFPIVENIYTSGPQLFGLGTIVEVSPNFSEPEVQMMLRITRPISPGVSNLNKLLRISTVWADKLFAGQSFRDYGKASALDGPRIQGATYGVQLGFFHVSTGSSQWGPVSKVQSN